VGVGRWRREKAKKHRRLTKERLGEMVVSKSKNTHKKREGKKDHFTKFKIRGKAQWPDPESQLSPESGRTGPQNDH